MVAGAAKYITKFTRFSGDVFGMLTAVMFMQQAVKGTVAEFRIKHCDPHSSLGPDSSKVRACEEFTSDQRLVNGLWASGDCVWRTADMLLGEECAQLAPAHGTLLQTLSDLACVMRLKRCSVC